MNNNKIAAGHLLAAFTILIWGTTFISTKILLKSYSPVEILFIRFTAGYLALLAVYPKFLKPDNIKHELYFIGAGFTGVTLYFLLENIALTYTFASNAGVIVSASPFFTAVLAHFFIKSERLQIRFFIGFAVAMTGIFLIGFNGNFVLDLNPTGDVLALLAAFTWAVYSVLIRKISAFGYNTILVTRRTFFYGIALMMPAVFIFGFNPDMKLFLKPENMFNILYLGLGASAICFVTWNTVVKILGAVTASAYIYMVPVVTVIFSAAILEERITWIAGLGTGLTLTGLLISEGRFGLFKRIFVKSARFNP